MQDPLEGCYSPAAHYQDFKARMNDKHLTRQIVIIHISDVHFGPKHQFNPEKTPGGDIPVGTGYPTLLEKMLEDLNQPDPGCPVLMCFTGDFTESGDLEEFEQAAKFIKGLAEAPVFGTNRGLQNTFIVPGNHDVVFDKNSPEARLAHFAVFRSNLYGAATANPKSWELLYDNYDESGAIIATLNSSMYVAKGKPDQDRGHVDVDQLSRFEKALKKIDPKRLQQAIKIALIHHHPVLIPPLAEPGRGYDAVVNSGQLLAILRRYGFHMVLHGHKHDPYVFTEDSRSAFRTTAQNPLLIVAGGSTASTELPTNRRNCYNRISIKWHPSAAQARILIETIALFIYDSDGNKALPGDWKWEIVRREDLHFWRGECIPTVKRGVTYTRLGEKEWQQLDQRPPEYKRLKGNMLSVEVRPSLMPKQGYEAVVWIAGHQGRELPVKVEWSAGEKFKTITTVTAENDTLFCASFDYWGPMLIQARITFGDKSIETDYIYARIPEDYTSA